MYKRQDDDDDDFFQYIYLIFDISFFLDVWDYLPPPQPLAVLQRGRALKGVILYKNDGKTIGIADTNAQTFRRQIIFRNTGYFSCKFKEGVLHVLRMEKNGKTLSKDNREMQKFSCIEEL